MTSGFFFSRCIAATAAFADAIWSSWRTPDPAELVSRASVRPRKPTSSLPTFITLYVPHGTNGFPSASARLDDIHGKRDALISARVLATPKSKSC